MSEGDEDRGTAPRLLALASAYTVLAVASVAALAFLRRDGAPRELAALNPFGPAETARQFFATSPRAVRISALLCFLSGFPLAIYTARAVERLEQSAARHTGLAVAFVGGLAASAGLSAAGLFLWVLSVPEATGLVAVSRTLHFLVFLCGGPAFAVGMGLLAWGVSASVRGTHMMPRWVVSLGFLIACSGALSTLGLLSVAMTVAIPITRVGGFVWLIATGASDFQPRR